MKQNHPVVFKDLCLYSEVCLILAEYSFRLVTRRFVHELFMDVDYHALYVEPYKILGIKWDQTQSDNLEAPPVSSSVTSSTAPNTAAAAGRGASGHQGGRTGGGMLGNLAEVASDDALSPP